jgi:cysteine synthase B
MQARLTLPAAIGGTPLVRLRAYEPRAGVEIYAKLESRNPGGSVKDRAALAMILDGERTGALPTRVIIDASSGNTGIAYAMLAASRGHQLELCLPANASPERRRILRALGARVILTDPLGGTDAAILEARRRAAESPERYFYPDQYANAHNWRAHFATTGPEILAQTRHGVTHFVAGLGTSGTFMGIGRRLRETLPGVQLISVQPDAAWHGLEGLKHMPSALVPPIYDPALADRNVSVATEAALALTRRLAREAGLLVGPSSGAALAGVLDVAADLRRGTIVTIFPDGGDRYLSEPWWDDGDGLVLARGVRAEIEAHAVDTYPHECCGALIGTDGRVTGALSLDNVTTLERRRRFLVSPDEYRAAESHADASGRRLLGFYHSHPDHPAEPSAFDLEQAWPTFSYVIVSVRERVARDLRSWRLRDDRSRFDEEPVQGECHVREDSDSDAVAAVHRPSGCR